MTLQLRHIKKCQWNRGWYVQLTEWIKPITMSKLKFKWMCFPYGVPWCSLLTRRGWNAGDERQAHVSRLFSHRCRVTSGRSARAISPCASCAATAARATRAAASAASSEDSRSSHKNTNLLCFLSYPKNDLFPEFFLQCIAVLHCFLNNSYEVWFMEEHWHKMKSYSLFIFFILSLCKSFL